MTPEESIKRAATAACPDGGHWPYTEDADIFVGWRPAGDSYERASSRRTRVKVTYDIALCYKRGAQEAAEAARFALHRALDDAGWTIQDCGPEAYNAATEMFLWPVTAARSFGLDQNGQPYDLMSEE